MLVRFWGTRGSLPVAATASIVQEKVAQALLAASGRSFADLGEARSFASTELDFATSGTFGSFLAATKTVKAYWYQAKTCP